MRPGRRFLREPERFALPGDWPALGGADLGLRIAGRRFRITGLDAEARRWLEERFRGFEDVAAGDAVEVAVARAPAAAFVAIDTRAWEYDLDLAPEREAVAVAGLGFAAHVRRRPLRAVLVTSALPAELPGVVENMLRILVAYALLAQDGALVHGAGVSREGRASVFFGVSGAGKTTVARLARAAGRSILSDDMVALAPESGGVHVRPIPFAGDFRDEPQRDPLELDALFRLRQAPHHGLRPLGRAEALAALVVCTPFVNRDPWVAEGLLDSLQGLLRRAPARELAFAPEAGFLDLIEAAS